MIPATAPTHVRAPSPQPPPRLRGAASPRAAALACLLAATPALAQTTPHAQPVTPVPAGAVAAPVSGATTSSAPPAPATTVPVTNAAPASGAAPGVAESGSSSASPVATDPTAADTPPPGEAPALLPRPVRPVVHPRAAEIRAACRDTTGVDAFMWAGAGGLLLVGVGLMIYGLTTPEAQRDLGVQYLNGMGPGLALGAIGVPFARGVIRSEDTLSLACDRVLGRGHGAAAGAAHAPDPHGAPAADPYDEYEEYEVAHRELSLTGRPGFPTLTLLLGLATASVGIGSAIAVATASPDLVRLFGGFAAAALTGWFIIPPTPRQMAASRYFARGYQPRGIGLNVTGVLPTLDVPGLGVFGTFF